MTARSRSLPLYCLILLLVLAALAGLWYGLGRDQALPDPRLANGKLQCASYSPFDHDQSPFNKPLNIRRERVEADVALLAQRFNCLRTYSVTGLDYLPELARQHGIKLMIGAWVSRAPKATRREIERVIRMANANPDVVSAVIVGNEALLRREITAKHLTALIEEVKSRVEQPVTYADVWEFWLRHPEVAPAVDFLTIHLLPYWEDDPTGIDGALAQVKRVHDIFEEKYAPKQIFIGETGWPSEGRQREDAVPSRVNEARFIRGVIDMAEANGWQYNLIEAFDQPWKRISEGTVGGYWGLFDAQRADKGVLAGPVSNLPDWPRWLGLSALLLAAGLLLGGAPRDSRSSWQLPLAAGIAAASLALWSLQLWLDSRHFGEWLWFGALLMLSLFTAARGLLQLNPPAAGWRAELATWLEDRAGILLLATALAGAWLMMAQVFDPRYRSFPTFAMLLPALTFALWPVRGPRDELGLLAVLIGLGLPIMLWQETLLNVQALGWGLVGLLLTGVLWRSRQPAGSIAPQGQQETA
ncbi:beta (1-6) glucans synthase [Pseudomonas sp. GCM10022188]|uniref:glycoside hydrolase family 17 protein n=1 Tax=Pseudomonas TaxID=286 RepID=UPI001E4DFE6A|nr:beta (1-6) glucans synthase [Pseudomonas oryzagri]MCC6076193.1 beta (1-6) glucans synthase [Pseudomonas oryzagri]